MLGDIFGCSHTKVKKCWGKKVMLSNFNFVIRFHPFLVYNRTEISDLFVKELLTYASFGSYMWWKFEVFARSLLKFHTKPDYHHKKAMLCIWRGCRDRIHWPNRQRWGLLRVIWSCPPPILQSSHSSRFFFARLHWFKGRASDAFKSRKKKPAMQSRHLFNWFSSLPVVGFLVMR